MCKHNNISGWVPYYSVLAKCFVGKVKICKDCTKVIEDERGKYIN